MRHLNGFASILLGSGMAGRLSGLSILIGVLITLTGFHVEHPENRSSTAINTTLNEARLGHRERT